MKLIICGFVVCALGMVDFMGIDWVIKKQYRGQPERKAWQRKKAWSELLIGISGILYAVIGTDEGWPAVIICITVLAAAVFGVLNNRRFCKECRRRDEALQIQDHDEGSH